MSLRFQALLLSLALLVALIPTMQLVDRFEQDLLLTQERLISRSGRQLAETTGYLLQAMPMQIAANEASQPPLYAYRLRGVIDVDGKEADWADQVAHEIRFGADDEASLRFDLLLGRDPAALYLFVRVVDNAVVYRQPGNLNIHRNDYVELAIVDEAGEYKRYTIAPMQPGAAAAFVLSRVNDIDQVVRQEPSIESEWAATPDGYNVEIRMPIELVTSAFAVSVTDVDETIKRMPVATLGTASTESAAEIGQLILPPARLEQALRELNTGNSRLRLVDNGHRLLADAGELETADGIWPIDERDATGSEDAPWRAFLPAFIHKPVEPDAKDTLADPAHVSGINIDSALAGKSMLIVRRSSDNRADVISSAHPVYHRGRIKAALVLEQNTNGLLVRRNRFAAGALETMFTFWMVAAGLLIGFASLVSFRLKRMATRLETITDSQGRVRESLPDSTVPDEIGTLQNNVNNLTTRLKRYNQYLEDMSKRLAHELRTPVTVVRSSLDNMEMQEDRADINVYIERAREGINRLATILNNMTEATRLEESLDPAETVYFDLTDVIQGCVAGYRVAYPEQEFELSIESEFEKMNGLPDLIAQMLDKLVGNAVEFAAPGSAVKVRLTEEGDAVIRVINTGPPLPADAAERLFDSMVSVRAADDTRKKSPNDASHLGLGLYIAKMIVLFHGGTISAHNREDTEGVIVTVSLPLMRITARS